MRELFKKLWENIKAFGLKIWGKIKAWAVKTALPWLKSSWMQIVNILVLFIIYGNTDSLPGVQTVAGLWLFVLLAYYIFWKFLGAEKIFKKEENISVKSKKSKK
jgi:hypothetical protein